MPNIKPVSDLRNYATVLKDISSGKLMMELEKGRISGEKEGWHTLEEIRKEFGIGN
jgi:hypothetical protein